MRAQNEGVVTNCHFELFHSPLSSLPREVNFTPFHPLVSLNPTLSLFLRSSKSLPFLYYLAFSVTSERSKRMTAGWTHTLFPQCSLPSDWSLCRSRSYNSGVVVTDPHGRVHFLNQIFDFCSTWQCTHIVPLVDASFTWYNRQWISEYGQCSDNIFLIYMVYITMIQGHCFTVLPSLSRSITFL